jgi:hypothetical protein
MHYFCTICASVVNWQPGFDLLPCSGHDSILLIHLHLAPSGNLDMTFPSRFCAVEEKRLLCMGEKQACPRVCVAAIALVLYIHSYLESSLSGHLTHIIFHLS